MVPELQTCIESRMELSEARNIRLKEKGDAIRILINARNWGQWYATSLDDCLRERRSPRRKTSCRHTSAPASKRGSFRFIACRAIEVFTMNR